MKRFYRAASLFLVLSITASQALAINTSAVSSILVEQGSGRVLYENNADEERLIASITKIMTALVALENGDLSEKYTVTAEDMAEGSSMYLVPGEEVELRELLYGLMLRSGNDAALAVAHAVGGELSHFVDMMNEKAEALGMTHSHFANPNGLDAEGHYSSARDMAVLTACAMKNEEFRRIVATTSVKIGDRCLTNHNKLLRIYSGCIGVKTGFTKAAGRTLVSAAQRDGMTLICVTLCDGDDWRDHMSLLDYGFETYQRKIIAKAGQPLTEIRIRGGTTPKIALAAAEDLGYPVCGEEKLTLKAESPLAVDAPVVPGQVLGRAYAYLDGEEVASVDLVAAEPSAAREEARRP